LIEATDIGEKQLFSRTTLHFVEVLRVLAGLVDELSS
jgi:hypothetical protein